MGVASAAVLWRGGAGGAIALGLAAAWASSSASVAWLMSAESSAAFWRAFGGGMALRLAALVALMLGCHFKAAWNAPALLLSYVFGVLVLLLFEFRRVRFK